MLFKGVVPWAKTCFGWERESKERYQINDDILLCRTIWRNPCDSEQRALIDVYEYTRVIATKDYQDKLQKKMNVPVTPIKIEGLEFAAIIGSDDPPISISRQLGNLDFYCRSFGKRRVDVAVLSSFLVGQLSPESANSDPLLRMTGPTGPIRLGAKAEITYSPQWHPCEDAYYKFSCEDGDLRFDGEIISFTPKRITRTSIQAFVVEANAMPFRTELSLDIREMI